MGNLIQKQAAAVSAPTEGKQTLNQMITAALDSEGIRKRLDELLGNRAPQYISTLITLINGSQELQQAWLDDRNSVIQSALRAASYDLPIDPVLGYAYIVPFKNKKNNYKYSAQFIPGWKGYHQLALRTGMYRKINVREVREHELVSFDPIFEDIKIKSLPYEDRKNDPVVGYVGYYMLLNGYEKIIYHPNEEIYAHEKKNRKGQQMTRLCREDFHAYALKTLYRELIGKWGIMSIEYKDSAQFDRLTNLVHEDDESFDVEPEYSILDGVEGSESEWTPPDDGELQE